MGGFKGGYKYGGMGYGGIFRRTPEPRCAAHSGCQSAGPPFGFKAVARHSDLRAFSGCLPCLIEFDSRRATWGSYLLTAYCPLCAHNGPAIKNLKCPVDFSRGLGLGRTWHRASQQRSPGTRRARIWERGRGASNKVGSWGSPQRRHSAYPQPRTPTCERKEHNPGIFSGEIQAPCVCLLGRTIRPLPELLLHSPTVKLRYCDISRHHLSADW